MAAFGDKEGTANTEAYRLTDIGSALEAISHAVEIRLPIVTEDVFIRTVIPILQHPWTDDAVNAWLKIVKEPMNPLRVAGRGENNETVVLFTVPSWFPRPGTSVAKKGDVSIEQIILYLRNENDRGNFSNDHYLAEYLDAIAARDSSAEGILSSIAIILSRYDKTFVDLMGKPLYELTPVAGGGVQSKTEYAPRSEDTFVSTGFADDED